jgi:tRNA threonylcarbamoyladenosine biosynthesis protein TsaB
LPCIDSVLREAGVALGDVDAIAVSVGPGSFTGLRVGVATVKGLAFGDAIPIVAVPTLAAVAHAADAAGAPVVAVLDAQRGEVYAAGFECGVEGASLVSAAPSESVYLPSELSGLLPPDCVLAGAGARACAEALGSTAPRLVEFTTSLVRAVAEVAQWGLAAGQTVSASELVPRYVRRAEAEVQRTGERFE